MALDAVVTLEAPDGSSTKLVVAVKQLVAMRDMPDQLARLRSRIARAGLAEAARAPATFLGLRDGARLG